MEDVQSGDMQEIANVDAADQQIETAEQDTSSAEVQVEEGTTEQPEKVEKVEKTTEVKEQTVPLKALKEERRKRQDFEKELAREKGAREAIEKLIQPQQETQYDPNEPITIAQAQEMLRKEREQDSINRQKEKILKSAVEVRKLYADSDFTYDDALEWANENLSKATMGALLSDENPAQSLYDLVTIKHPELKNKQKQTVQTEAVKKTVETIQRHINTPRTLSNASGSDRTLDQIKAIEDMSRDDFEKLIQENIRKQSG